MVWASPPVKVKWRSPTDRLLVTVPLPLNLLRYRPKPLRSTTAGPLTEALTRLGRALAAAKAEDAAVDDGAVAAVSAAVAAGAAQGQEAGAVHDEGQVARHGPGEAGDAACSSRVKLPTAPLLVMVPLPALPARAVWLKPLRSKTPGLLTVRMVPEGRALLEPALDRAGADGGVAAVGAGAVQGQGCRCPPWRSCRCRWSRCRCCYWPATVEGRVWLAATSMVPLPLPTVGPQQEGAVGCSA